MFPFEKYKKDWSVKWEVALRLLRHLRTVSSSHLKNHICLASEKCIKDLKFASFSNLEPRLRFVGIWLQLAREEIINYPDFRKFCELPGPVFCFFSGQISSLSERREMWEENLSANRSNLELLDEAVELPKNHNIS